MAVQIYTEGWTNLHHAVVGRFTNLVHTLLEVGSLEYKEGIVNVPDGQGRTPLHLVCSGVGEPKDLSSKTLSDIEQIIELLLNNGANLEILDNSGKSPFHCLVYHWLNKQFPLGEVGHKIITQFMQHGANVNAMDVNGRTPLHYVVGFSGVCHWEWEVPVVKTDPEVYEELRRLSDATTEEEYEVMRRLDIFKNDAVKRCEEVRRQKNYAKRLRNQVRARFNHEQIRDKHIKYNLEYVKEFLSKLLRSGANVNASDNKGNTPLYLAISANKFDLFRELLKEDVNINLKNCEGQTLLHHALSDYEKFKDFGVLLLHRGALASITDNDGYTPVDFVWNGKYFFHSLEDFSKFLKHLILLISVKLHPQMSITNGIGIHKFQEMINSYELECTDLNTYFTLNGRSQLSLLIRYNCLPTYTKNDFFQTIINRDEFSERFPNYSLPIKNKFSHDQKRMKLIDQCTTVFLYFDEQIQNTEAGCEVSTRNAQWKNLPEELKLQILSYLSTDYLEDLGTYLTP